MYINNMDCCGAGELCDWYDTPTDTPEILKDILQTYPRAYYVAFLLPDQVKRYSKLLKKFNFIKVSSPTANPKTRNKLTMYVKRGGLK